MKYRDGLIAVGLPANFPVTIEGVADGCTVKVRFRDRQMAKAFVRHPNGYFTAWTLEWVNGKPNTLRIYSPIAANIRTK